MQTTNSFSIAAILGLLAQTGLAQSQSADWPVYGGDLSATRFSPLAEITKTNVTSLKRTCASDTDESTAFQTGPIVLQDVLYFTTYNTTFAINASSCALKWKYSRPGPPLGLGVNRGITFDGGKLFRGTGDARIVALEASTGKPVWDVSIGDPQKGESVPLAPLAWNGMVFAGNAGGDIFGVTGRIYALSAEDGHQLWQFNVVPDSGPARATWKNVNEQNPATGGATWTTYSLDPDTGVLWVSTGNVAPDFLLALHPGDNLYTTSVLALDAKTGALLGYVQPDPHAWRPAARCRRGQGRDALRHRSLECHFVHEDPRRSVEDCLRHTSHHAHQREDPAEHDDGDPLLSRHPGWHRVERTGVPPVLEPPVCQFH